MKITREQFNTAKKTFSQESLSDTQKNTMLSHIYVESEQAVAKPTVSPLSFYFVFFKQKAFVAVAVIVFASLGTTYASAQSLPGDLLYGMKVNILEPTGLALRFSEESKNEYKISLLKKRVDELEKLKQKGKLNDDSKKASSDATEKNIRALENSAIFNEEGENEYVSEKVKIYNTLIDSELKIETRIELDAGMEPDVNEVIKTEATNDVQRERDNPLDATPSFETGVEVGGYVETEVQNAVPADIGNSSDTGVIVPGL
jgi:hypothetical protein